MNPYMVYEPLTLLGFISSLRMTSLRVKLVADSEVQLAWTVLALLG